MKKLFTYLSLLIIIQSSNQLFAQIDVKQGMDSMIQNKFLLNFMVPDIPAFNALEENPSDFLKPSAPRDLAVMFSSFRSGNEFVIPSSFAAEFAPALFASTKINLHDYQTKYLIRLLSKTRLSIGTKYNDSKQIGYLAAGIKLTLVDEGDYRNDTAFLKEKIYKLLGAYEGFVAAKKLEYLKAHNITALELANNEALSQQIEDTLILGLMKADFKNSVENYKRTHWNSNRLEFAYSVVAKSTDSVLNKSQTDKHLFWLVYALKPGKKCDWAQIIFALSDQLHKGSDFKLYNQFSVNSRAYFGSNKAKGFMELQYKNVTTNNLPINSILINLGLDIDIYSGVWVHLAAGSHNILGNGGRSELMGNMKLYLSLPENFKLF